MTRLRVPPWVLAAVLAAVIAGAYARTLGGGFYLDDNLNIVRNQTLRHLGAVSTWMFPPPGVPTAGRPILNLAFALNYVAGGLALAPYHVVNIAIHAAAACALFGLARRTLASAAVPAKVSRHRDALAWLGAAVWALHPLATSAVTYLSQRAESLMGLFFLLMLYCVSRGWRRTAVAFCWCGMLTKETMASAPLLIWLYDRTFVTGTFRSALRQRPGFYAALAAAWLWLPVSLGSGTVRGIGFAAGTPALDYARTEAEVVLRYLGLAFWPHPLVLDYGPFVTAWSVALPCLAAIAGLVAATLWLLRRHPMAGFFPASFFLLLAPTSSIIPIAMQPMAESRMYLPLAAVVFGTGVAIVRWAGRAGCVALGLLGIAAAAATVARNGLYLDRLAMWRQNAAARPENYRAHNHLGIQLSHAGDAAGAEAEERKALRLRPNDSDVLGDLGVVLVDHGRAMEAIPYLQAAVRLEPTHAVAHYDLGRADADTGHPDLAEAQYRLALRDDPDLEHVHNNLALALQAQHRYAEAEPHFQAALAQRGVDSHTLAIIRYNYANMLDEEHDYARAEGMLRGALELEPDFAAAWGNLGAVLSHQGRLKEAEPAFVRQLELAPGDQQAERNLAAVRAALGR